MPHRPLRGRNRLSSTRAAVEPSFIQMPEDSAQEGGNLLAGLQQPAAHVSAKYLYDALGSRLFEAITELPEYYPTRTEAAVFGTHALELVAAAGRGATLIDLGAGNCVKAAKLLPALRPAQYVAVDISVDFLRDSLASLQLRFPDLPMLGLGQDFSRRLALPAAVRSERRLFFYPGSSLGNFTPAEARAFLGSLRSQCGEDGGLLLGVDLVKDHATLNAAYDDALGVTAAFNLNLLRHLNVVAGTDFRVQDWKHVAFFNAAESRIEMHLESRLAVDVRWPGGARRFAAGERIHTENSYKYRLDQVEAMVKEVGFAKPSLWTDPRHWFAVCHAPAS